MRTNREDPKSAMRGSFGKNEAQKSSMTKVGDKKHEIARKMASIKHKYHELRSGKSKEQQHREAMSGDYK